MTKYNYSYLGTNDPLTDVSVMVSSATHGLLFPIILLTIFIVLAYVFMRRTQDIGKSIVSSLFATSLSGVIIYYLGKQVGTVLIADLFIYGLWITFILSLLGVMFFRLNKD